MSYVNPLTLRIFHLKEVRRQQVGTRTRQTVCFGLRNLPWFRLCCGVKVAEYLRRSVRLVILFLAYWASPHWPTLNLVVGGLPQGLARGLREGYVSHLLHGSGAACLQLVEVYQVWIQVV